MSDLTGKIKQYIKDENMLERGDTVIVGLSGGADSVCLIRVLSDLKKEIGISLRAIHINHGIRGEDAYKDERFCWALCEDLGIPFHSIEADIPAIAKEKGIGEEECGRYVRYEEFDKLAAEYPNSKIAVAHHLNDQAETVLFRVIRGTGLTGLKGMLPVNGKIIRPLLCVKREDIEEYLNEIGQKWCTDATNADNNYSRNIIRNILIPKMEEVSYNVAEHLSELSREAKDASDYLRREANKLLSNAAEIREENYCKINAAQLSEADRILREYAIRELISSVSPKKKDYTRHHVYDVLGLLKGHEARESHLPYGVKAVREGEYLYVGLKDDTRLPDITGQDVQKAANELSIVIPGEIRLFDGKRLKADILDEFDMADIPRNPYTKWFDYDRIDVGLLVRYRCAGDYLIADSAGSRQKLRDYLINKKIVKSKREEIMLVANGSKILWIIGYRISEDVKVTSNTKRVLQLSIEEGEE